MMGLTGLVIIVGALFLVKYMLDRNPHQLQSNSPMDILKRRYASGEISREEFENRKKDLV